MLILGIKREKEFKLYHILRRNLYLDKLTQSYNVSFKTRKCCHQLRCGRQ
jgi:hypothetical protein